jgi:hypothetical protein
MLMNTLFSWNPGFSQVLAKLRRYLAIAVLWWFWRRVNQ